MASARDTVTGLIPSRRTSSRVEGSRSPAGRAAATARMTPATLAMLLSDGMQHPERRAHANGHARAHAEAGVRAHGRAHAHTRAHAEAGAHGTAILIHEGQE